MVSENEDRLKLEPRYGYYPWWPEDGDDWVHPDDVATARMMIPSTRIWRHDVSDDPFVQLCYGEVSIRVHPTLWIEVSSEGIEIGDWVEIKSKLQKNTPRIGRIREMNWDSHSHSIRYQIEFNQQLIPTTYGREDFRRVENIAD